MMAVGLADNRDVIANSPYLTKVGDAMLGPGPALRLTVYLKVNARWHHRPVYGEIVQRAHDAGLAGASVFRGDEGFGRSEHIHTTHLFSFNGEVPASVVIIDAEDRIRAFLPRIEEVLEDGIVFLEPVEVVRYVGKAASQ